MKFERVKGNVPVFSGEYDGRDRTIFGGTTQSNDINQQFTPEFKKGWGIVGKNEFPTLQDFNALGFTHSALIGYLYQSGVAQWVAGADYYTGSIAVQGVDLYVAIQDKPTSQPNSLQGWRLVSPALLNTTGQSTTAPMTQKATTDAVNKKWDIQTTSGTGNVARMSEVTKKADTSYVNTELGKKRGLNNFTFNNWELRLAPSEWDYISLYCDAGEPHQRGFVASWGKSDPVYHMMQKKTGVLALTSDVDKKWDIQTTTGSGDIVRATELAWSAPVGMIVSWDHAVAPKGWLFVRDQKFSATEYPELAKLYPSLTLNDRRGTVDRALDAGRGFDVGRVLGSYQQDAMVRLYGEIIGLAHGTKFGGSNGVFTKTADYESGNAESGGVAHRVIFDNSVQTRIANETRMKNVATNKIIKAK